MLLMKGSLPKMIAVIGPTASGKTDLALALAREFNGEIIGCDSRQFYRGLDIGAGTVPGELGEGVVGRAWIAEGVPHYFINILEPDEKLTVAEYKEQVIAKANEIAEHGKLPMLVGGSMLFASAVIDNYEVPEVPADERLRLELSKLSVDDLVARLEVEDPAYALRAGRNPRYVIRALEVMAATGRTMTELQRKGEPQFDVLTLGVTRSRDELYDRINRRFDQMMKDGLLEETRAVGEKYGWDCPALASLGHRQIAMHLRGELSLAESVDLAKRETRHYAKRQMTWFRRDNRIRWVQSENDARELIRLHLER